ncbi:hypothetical protein ACFOY2_17925 [Nonomuraea purpurea]|uniref:Uncharacterized protein n=1 Tax=Nonomuraea purpurea TaxID=1849276 RepID=A0ABV8G8Z1_9ACTN
MTDIFTVSIHAVEGSTLRARVHIINPDVPFVSDEAAFPLALLVDAWFLLKNGYLRNEASRDGRGDRYPFSAQRGKDVVMGMRRGEEFHELYRLKRGGRTPGYDPADFYRRAATIVTSHSVSPVHNVPSWSEVSAFDDPDEPWEPGEREKFAGLEGPADLSEYRTWVLLRERPFSSRPYVDLTATVSDASYVEHLIGGMRWSTTQTGYGY